MNVRFSMVSSRPIPSALIHHIRQTITDVEAHPDEREVRSVGLNAITWFFELSDNRIGPYSDSLEKFKGEMRGPAMALAIDSAFITGPMAENGPAAVVTDVDSTFITTEVIEMLAAHAGREDEVRQVTETAMRGELDFAVSLEQRVATLEGVPSSVFDDVFADIRLTEGAQRLVDAVHARNGKFGLVSGGFSEVVGPLAERSGIDTYVANGLEVEGGSLTGRTYGDIIDAEAKVSNIIRWQDEWQIPPEMILCAGDGANDLPMMDHVGLGVSFMGKPIVLENADCAINFPRLDAIAALVGWDIDG